MTAVTRRVVCFDLWGTLAHTEPVRSTYADVLLEDLPSLRKAPKNIQLDREVIYGYVRDHLMTRRLSYKQMSEELLGRFGGLEVDGEVRERLVSEMTWLWDYENKMWGWFDGVAEFLSEFRSRDYRVVLVTNSTMPACKKVKAGIARVGGFDRIFFSAFEGVSKPNPHVWKRIHSWFPGVPPEQFTMVGNREEDDLHVPRTLGWSTVLVNSRPPNFVRIFGEVIR